MVLEAVDQNVRNGQYKGSPKLSRMKPSFMTAMHSSVSLPLSLIWAIVAPPSRNATWAREESNVFSIAGFGCRMGKRLIIEAEKRKRYLDCETPKNGNEAAKMRRRTKIAVVAVVLTPFVLGYAWWRHHYPYGMSHCCDLCLSSALHDYAATHGGAFPAGEATPEASLSLCLGSA
jgi:hypothetical protein